MTTSAPLPESVQATSRPSLPSRGDAVQLRYSARYRRTQPWRIAGLIMLVPVGGVIVGKEDFFVGLAIGTAMAVFVGIYAVSSYAGLHGLALSGTVLTGDGVDIDLADSDEIQLRQVHRLNVPPRLFLRMGRVSIQIGDATHPSYLEPDSLRALSAAMESSEHPTVRLVAERLRELARPRP